MPRDVLQQLADAAKWQSAILDREHCRFAMSAQFHVQGDTRHPPRRRQRLPRLRCSVRWRDPQQHAVVFVRNRVEQPVWTLPDVADPLMQLRQQ